MAIFHRHKLGWKWFIDFEKILPPARLFCPARLMFFKNFPTCTFILYCTSIRYTRVYKNHEKHCNFALTPGFGDSDNDDNNLINEMVDALKDIIKTANGFVLLFNGQSERFDAKAQQMIREMEALFGNGFWDHVVLGVSFWHFDYNSIQGRNNSGKKS